MVQDIDAVIVVREAFVPQRFVSLRKGIREGMPCHAMQYYSAERTSNSCDLDCHEKGWC